MGNNFAVAGFTVGERVGSPTRPFSLVVGMMPW